MIGAVVSGTLVGDPVERTTRTGARYVTVTVRVPAGDDAQLIGVAAFDQRAAERLMQMRAGGAVSACGVMEPTRWTGRDGAERTGWRMTASEIMTAYGAGQRRRRSAEGDSDE
ncbi:MAG: single-stranded DNA-binding protein [Gammaproteobacteria bacterium]|nr:single-stranded DNA-binding protein [Gammaproteobacteria bacterium]